MAHPRIDRIECFALRVPLPTTFVGSTYRVSERWTIVTEIYTNDGAVGRVYNGDPRDEAHAIMNIMEQDLAPLVIGRNPLSVGSIWQEMFDLTINFRDKKLLMAAISCLDCAIWDVRAKLMGVNIAALLGGDRADVPVIAIAGYYEDGKSLEDLSIEMERLRHQGVAGCKMKVGGLTPEEDAERATAARRGGGPEFVLAVDANRAWTVEEALRFAKMIEHLDIAWFEEPCHWYADVAAMNRLASKTSIPICAGQSEITSYGVLELIRGGGVDVINFDASEGGGVSGWSRAAALSSAFNCRTGHHEEPQIAVQLLASVTNSTYVECFPDVRRDPLWANLLTAGPSVANGKMALPQGLGFGLEFDNQFVEKYRV